MLRIIGFFVGILFFTSPVYSANPALYPSHKYFSGGTTDCTLTTGNWNGTASSSDFTQGVYIAQVILQQGTAGREYYLDLYNDGGSTVIARATSTSLGGGKYGFAFPEHTHTNQTYDFVLRNGGYNTGWQRWSGSASSPEFTFTSVCSNSTPNVAVYIASTSPAVSSSTTTIPLYIPNPLAKLNSMTCSYTSTSTTCIPQYASTTNQITPENLTLLALVFLGSFFLTYWLIRKLT